MSKLFAFAQTIDAKALDGVIAERTDRNPIAQRMTKATVQSRTLEARDAIEPWMIQMPPQDTDTTSSSSGSRTTKTKLSVEPLGTDIVLEDRIVASADPAATLVSQVGMMTDPGSPSVTVLQKQLTDISSQIENVQKQIDALPEAIGSGWATSSVAGFTGQINMEPSTTLYNSVATASGKFIVGAYLGGSVNIRNAQTGAVLQTLSTGTGRAYFLAADPARDIVYVSAGARANSFVIAIDVTHGNELWRTQAPDNPNHLTVSPDGKVVLVDIDYRGAVALDSTSGEIMRFGGADDYAGTALSNGRITFFRSGSQVWLQASDHSLKQLATLPGLAYTIGVSPDQSRILVGGAGGVMDIIDLATGKEVRWTDPQNPTAICDAVFTGDSSIAVGYENGVVSQLSLSSGSPVVTGSRSAGSGRIQNLQRVGGQLLMRIGETNATLRVQPLIGVADADRGTLASKLNQLKVEEQALKESIAESLIVQSVAAVEKQISVPAAESVRPVVNVEQPVANKIESTPVTTSPIRLTLSGLSLYAQVQGLQQDVDILLKQEVIGGPWTVFESQVIHVNAATGQGNILLPADRYPEKCGLWAFVADAMHPGAAIGLGKVVDYSSDQNGAWNGKVTLAKSDLGTLTQPKSVSTSVQNSSPNAVQLEQTFRISQAVISSALLDTPQGKALVSTQRSGLILLADSAGTNLDWSRDALWVRYLERTPDYQDKNLALTATSRKCSINDVVYMREVDFQTHFLKNVGAYQDALGRMLEAGINATLAELKMDDRVPFLNALREIPRDPIYGQAFEYLAQIGVVLPTDNDILKIAKTILERQANALLGQQAAAQNATQNAVAQLMNPAYAGSGSATVSGMQQSPASVERNAAQSQLPMYAADGVTVIGVGGVLFAQEQGGALVASNGSKLDVGVGGVTGEGTLVLPQIAPDVGVEHFDTSKPIVVIFLGSNEVSGTYDEKWATDTKVRPGETPAYGPDPKYAALNSLAARLKVEGIQVKVFETGDNPTKLLQPVEILKQGGLSLASKRYANATEWFQKNYSGKTDSAGVVVIGYSWGSSMATDVLQTAVQQLSVKVLGSVNIDGVSLDAMRPQLAEVPTTKNQFNLIENTGYKVPVVPQVGLVLDFPVFGSANWPTNSQSKYETVLFDGTDHTSIENDPDVLFMTYRAVLSVIRDYEKQH